MLNRIFFLATLLTLISALHSCTPDGNPVVGTPSLKDSASTQTRFTISGKITGAVSDLSSIIVTTGTAFVFTDSSGNFSIENLRNGSYTITPTRKGIRFTPETRTVTISGRDAVNSDFIAMPS